MKKIFSLLLCGAMAMGFTACEKNDPTDGSGDGSGNGSGENTPTFELKVNFEGIDLGLPSGILWAPCNVGAKTPDQYGDYFAWGETKSKNEYSWGTYKHVQSSLYEDDPYDFNGGLTKYCIESEAGKVDNKTRLEDVDDAAKVNWGGDWRMPTQAEAQELYDNCTWNASTLNGVAGYQITGTNGNSIFLPSAGWHTMSDWYDAGIIGSYWTATLCDEYSGGACNILFYHDEYAEDHPAHMEDFYEVDEYYQRRIGISIRPVMSKK